MLVVGRIKDDTTLRVIAHDKSSLAPEGMSIAFRMDKDNGFTWEGVYDITVEELLSGESRGQKTKDAKSFLAEILAGQSHTRILPQYFPTASALV